jgi:hypothetical protein
MPLLRSSIFIPLFFFYKPAYRQAGIPQLRRLAISILGY